jgi:N-methylhydantoinase B
VLVFFAPGGGGFGDPLDREPERVATDVANGWVSRERARENYGVALAGDGSIDTAATTALRNDTRAGRKQRPTGEWVRADVCRHPAGSGAGRVGENIEVGPDQALHCRRCGEALTGPSGRVAEALRPLSTASPWMSLRHGGDPPNFVLEEISCPSCATLLSVREVRRGNGR